jgi:hypothetical protein
MVSAVDSALSGLASAGRQLEYNARIIARPPENNAAQTDKAASDKANAIVHEDIASYDFKANLKTIKVADNMEKALLDIKS